jgi:hypothetical protein
MMSTDFKKTIFISLLGHITALSIFSFSFGNRIPNPDFAGVSFWGTVLPKSELITTRAFNPPDIRKLFLKEPQISSLDKIKKEYPLLPDYYLKPKVNLAFNEDKAIFVQKPTNVLPVSIRKESVIMFHPELPYNFLLYFKDRQAVHIELMFNIIPSGKTHSIVIKRKISSGNLEADLLSMRYISHYLFIQQARFLKNNWQTVKIDLAPKE